MRSIVVFSFLLFFISCFVENETKPLPKAPTKKVKVAVVIFDPIVYGRRIHEYLKTPGVERRIWNDPWKLNADYKATLKEVSGGVVDYHITEVIDTKECFTFFTHSGEKINQAKLLHLLQEPGWKTLKEQKTSFDYKAFVEYFGFDKKRDADEINEVWVWAPPYLGMWESNMMGEGAFWLNSEPTSNVNCKELLCVMGLNYERDLACALESYGHRFESMMMKIYGWWNYPNKHTMEELTPWEVYCAYAEEYNKFNPSMSHIGKLHYPPNAEKEYDWSNLKKVKTYADNWLFYPDVMNEKPRSINCKDWDCTHLGYVKWWFRHIPNFDGMNDGKLNNWWHYVVDYNEAVLLSQSK